MQQFSRPPDSSDTYDDLPPTYSNSRGVRGSERGSGNGRSAVAANSYPRESTDMEARIRHLEQETQDDGNSSEPDTQDDGNSSKPETQADGNSSKPETQADGNSLEPETQVDGNSSEPETQDADSRWIQTLTEPELDLVISLKELAVTQAAHFDLSHRFHLRTLRALGIILLEHFKGQLNQNSSGLEPLDRLALLRDPDVHVPSQVQSTSNGVDKKRKQLQHGPDEESTSSSKKMKHEELREEWKSRTDCLSLTSIKESTTDCLFILSDG